MKRQIAFNKIKSKKLYRTPYGKFTTKRQHVSVQLYTAILLTTFYNLPHKNGANLTVINIGKGRITFLILTTGAYITTIPFVIGKSDESKNE